MEELPLICYLLGGVFDTTTRIIIWDVEEVLKHPKQLSHNTNLSDKDLTLKLTMLLALTAASRCCELKYLSTKFMTKSNDKYNFVFS